MAEVLHPPRVRPRRSPADKGPSDKRPPVTPEVPPRRRGDRETLTVWACFVSAGLHAAAILWLLQATPTTAPVLLAVQTGRASIALRASLPSEGARRGEMEAPPLTLAPSPAWEEQARREAAAQSPVASTPRREAPLECRSTAPPRSATSGKAELPAVEALSSFDLPSSPSSAAPLAVASAVEAQPDARQAAVAAPPRAVRGLPVGDGTAESPAAVASLGSRASAGADAELPAVMSNPAPVYPPELLAARVTGTVKLLVRVAADGTVLKVSVAKSSGRRAFDEAALAAVRSWRFQPARRGGVAVEFDVTQTVRFVLP